MWIIAAAVAAVGFVKLVNILEAWDQHPYTASKEKLDRVAFRKSIAK